MNLNRRTLITAPALAASAAALTASAANAAEPIPGPSLPSSATAPSTANH